MEIKNSIATINQPQEVKKVVHKFSSPRFNAGQDRFQRTTELPIYDKQADLEKALKQQAKKEKSNTKKQNISIAANVVLAAAFATIAATSVYSLLKGQSKAIKTEFKTLGDLPALNSGSFKKKFAKEANKIIKLLGNKNAKQKARFIILTGPTGTGKTLSAQVLAKEMGAKYGEVQFSELSSPYIGETSVRITNKFKEFAKLARKNPNEKYVVTFNEIDSLITDIDKLGSNNLHLGQNRTAFLNGLDSIKDIPNLTIIGTTNVNPKSSMLDKATLSRFGKNILEITEPNQQEALAAFKYHIGKCKDVNIDEGALNEITETVISKHGVQRDIANLTDAAYEEFLINEGTKSFETCLREAVDSQEVWAAGIGKEVANAEVLGQYLEKPGALDFLLRLLGMAGAQ